MKSAPSLRASTFPKQRRRILAVNNNRERRNMKSKLITAVLGLALGAAIPLLAAAPFPATR
jgi:hypothetical protein